MHAPVPAPRLHVLMRPGSYRAVVLRRGPSRTFCSIGWDLRKDTFSVGQWCKHKIYPERSDISPDGQWLLYFALDGHWDSETRGAWTALARAPYLKAVRLWPKGDTWGGGGLLHADDRSQEGELVAPGLRLVHHGKLTARLLRDGWSATSTGYHKAWADGWRVRLSERPPDAARLHPEHALEHDDGRVIALPDWEWADVDVARRLLFARAGGLYMVACVEHLTRPRLLFDTNPLTFEPIKAPYDDETMIMPSVA